MLAARLAQHGIDAVCGPMLGGAFLAQSVASTLGIEFYYAERFAPPSGDALFAVEYRLPPSITHLVQGKAFAVVDDAISAGSAIRGTITTLQTAGAKVVAVGALIVMGDNAARYCQEQGFALESITHLPYEVWLPSECPQCAEGLPLQDKG